ncbi:hypothetical protein Tco_1351568 [Tanacetum coccineum]
MFGTIPPIPPPFGTSSGNSGSPNVNRVDTMPTTTDPINTTTTTNVSQSVVDENLPQLLDSRGGSHVTNVPAFDKEDFTNKRLKSIIISCLPNDFMKSVIKYKTVKEMWNDLNLAHEGPSDIRDTKIAALRLMFNAFKSHEGEKDSDSDVEEDQRTSNEFMADLNAEYHERALLANQKRFYKRSGRNSGNHQKYYKGKYKGLKAEMVVLTKRIDDMTKGKSEKGKKEKEKSEKGLIGESFDWDDESVSSDDEGSTKIRAFMAITEDEVNLENESLKDEIIDLKKVIEKWTCSKVTLDQLLSENVHGNIVKVLGGKGRRKEKISSKDVVFTKADESSSMLAPKITSNSETECDSQEPLPPLPKLIGAAPSGTS